MRRALGAGITLAVVAAACGNFFPNPENVVLPSSVRDYELICAPAVPRLDCEGRAEELVKQKRREQPDNRVVKVQIDRDMGYTITFSDGTAESLIVN